MELGSGTPGSFLSLVEEDDALGDLAGQCDVDAVQVANVRQLHPILHDLVNTTFFRLFRVNLQYPKCAFWQQPDKEKEKDAASGSSTCTGNVPGFFGSSSASSFMSSFDSFQKAPEETPCSVSAEEEDESQEGTAGQSVEGGLLESGLDFDEDDGVDRSITVAEQVASNHRDNETEVCEFEEDLPTYWVDMCSGVDSHDEIEDVNLIKNPERNTGYNGSHIWEAMYNENCFEVGSGLPRGRYGSRDDMCYEERILYRLLSGWHASTTIAIAKNFYAPGTKRKGAWAPNPDKYMDAFGQHPDRVKNLHFSFVVMLRAVKKVAPFLRSYSYSTGDSREDAMTKRLVRRLLDSQVLSVCSQLFDAFDESSLFQHGPEHRSQLKRQFKSVFRNITELVDCVQCQKCRLHAKVFSLGLGTALKILLTPPVHIPSTTSRDEVVAMVNVLWKLSEAMEDAKELAQEYWKQHSSRASQKAVEKKPEPKSETPSLPSTEVSSAGSLDRRGLLDGALGAVRQAALSGALSSAEEEAVLRALVVQPPSDEVLLLSRHYASAKPALFAALAQEAAAAALVRPGTAGVAESPGQVRFVPDAVVIGGGLAGMVTAVSILDRGGRVTLVEKQNYLGGNSGKASSGINAALETSVESLVSDTTRSAGSLARAELIQRLAEDSSVAVPWLRDRTGVDLSMRSQLGGHTVQRTLRPSNAFVGAELTFAIGQVLNKMAADRPQQFRLLTKTKWTGLSRNGASWHVNVVVNGTEQVVEAPAVVIASGGFGHDTKEAESLLLKHRPDLEGFPTTLGSHTTGDGLKIARDIGAQLIDMDRVQLHPTGFVDPAKPSEHTKTLAAELLRGVGGLLLNRIGSRFTNELGTRQAVVNGMLKEAASEGDAARTFALVLNGKAAAMADRHTTLYSKKGLLKKVTGVRGLAEHLGVDDRALNLTFMQYNAGAAAGKDAFNRTVFPVGHWPVEEDEEFFVGKVCPVIHYTMGGIAIDTEGHVLGQDGKAISGLYAIGEASGGVHGDNRLAGNSLLECTVFGRRVGLSMPIRAEASTTVSEVHKLPQEKASEVSAEPSGGATRTIDAAELLRHNAESDRRWVALYGQVYDLTDYVDEHPGGPEAITDVAGADGTETFAAVHNRELLEAMGFEPVGVLAD